MANWRASVHLFAQECRYTDNKGGRHWKTPLGTMGDPTKRPLPLSVEVLLQGPKRREIVL